MINLLDFNRSAMQAFFAELGEKPYRTQQVLQALHQHGVDSIDGLTTLSKTLREKLKTIAEIKLPTVVVDQLSDDGTRKWLLQLEDVSMSCIPNPNGAPPYWRDVGTIDAFWSANLDLASINPELDIYDTDWPIWTYQRQLPPTKFVPDRNGENGVSVNTIVSGGCIVSG